MQGFIRSISVFAVALALAWPILNTEALLAKSASPKGLQITGVSPQSEEVLKETPDSVALTFSAPIETHTLNQTMFRLYRSGGDNVFGNGNDIPIDNVRFEPQGSDKVKADLTGVSLPSDYYWIVVRGGEKGYLKLDGEDDMIKLPDGLLSEFTTLTVEARFRVEGPGTLLGMQEGAYPSNVHSYAPVLYFGRDGKLRGRFWGDFSIQSIIYDKLFFPGDGSPEPVTCRTMLDGSRVCGVAPEEQELSMESPTEDAEAAISPSGSTEDWHHVALVGDQSAQSLYVDGNLVGENRGRINHLNMKFNQLGMGYARREHWSYVKDGWFPLNGEIEEFRLWNVARTRAEINETMNVPLHGSEEGLVACYEFEEGGGQIARDRSPHKNDATLGTSDDEDASDPKWEVALIQDRKGNALDGEFTGSFPTGDGQPGGQFVSGFLLDRGIQITSPADGDVWLWGEVQKIQWLAPRVRHVKIECSLDAGKDWKTLSEVTSNDGEYVWEVPSIESDAFQIRITDVDAPANSTVSESSVSIKPGRLTVTAPNGGEVWPRSVSQDIKWTSEGSRGQVRVEVSYDNGENWTLIVDQLADTGAYHWELGEESASEALIRVTNCNDGQMSDVSDKPFTIYREAANPRSDINGDGEVDEEDMEILKKDMGTRVKPGQPPQVWKSVSQTSYPRLEVGP